MSTYAAILVLHSYNSDIGSFQVVHRFVRLFIFLNFCVFILFQLDIYFFLLFQIIVLTPGFLPVTIGSLNIFLYFIWGIFKLFFHF